MKNWSVDEQFKHREDLAHKIAALIEPIVIHLKRFHELSNEDVFNICDSAMEDALLHTEELYEQDNPIPQSREGSQKDDPRDIMGKSNKL